MLQTLLKFIFVQSIILTLFPLFLFLLFTLTSDLFRKINYYMSRGMRKPAFCICENKDADQLICVFFFAVRMVQSLFYLNLKFQASSHLLWLYSPVCVGPGRKPRSPVFSERGSFYLCILKDMPKQTVKTQSLH